MEEAIYLNTDQPIHTNTLILSLAKHLKFVGWGVTEANIKYQQ